MEMASQGNQHSAYRIGTFAFPVYRLISKLLRSAFGSTKVSEWQITTILNIENSLYLYVDLTDIHKMCHGDAESRTGLLIRLAINILLFYFFNIQDGQRPKFRKKRHVDFHKFYSRFTVTLAAIFR